MCGKSRKVTEDFPGGHPSERAPAAKHRRERRSGLQGAATAGAAGLAATAIGAAAGPALAATSRPPAADQSHDTAGTHAGPIVVHVRDARSGDIEVFAGTSQTRVIAYMSEVFF